MMMRLEQYPRFLRKFKVQFGEELLGLDFGQIASQLQTLCDDVTHLNSQYRGLASSSSIMAIFHRLKGWQVARQPSKGSPDGQGGRRFFENVGLQHQSSNGNGDTLRASGTEGEDVDKHSSNNSSPSSAGLATSRYSQSQHILTNAATTLLLPERLFIGEFHSRVMVEDTNSPMSHSHFSDSVLLFNDLLLWTQYQPSKTPPLADLQAHARSRSVMVHLPVKEKQLTEEDLLPDLMFVRAWTLPQLADCHVERVSESVLESSYIRLFDKDEGFRIFSPTAEASEELLSALSLLVAHAAQKFPPDTRTRHVKLAPVPLSNKKRTKPSAEERNAQMCKHLPRVVLERILEVEFRARGRTNPHLLLKNALCQLLENSTVMIADVSGFTKLSEQMAQQLGEGGAEQVTYHVNNYFTILLEIMEKHGGDVVKFSGDAIIVLFTDSHSGRKHQSEAAGSLAVLGERYKALMGVPDRETRSSSDCAVHAVQCGLELQANGYYEALGVKLSLHVAVASGAVYMLYVGGTNGEWDFMLAGRPFSELGYGVDLSKSGEVVAAKSTWQLVHSFFDGISANNNSSSNEEDAGDQYIVQNAKQDIPPRGLPPVDVNADEKSTSSALRTFLSRCVLNKLDCGQTVLNELRRASVVFVILKSLKLNVDLRTTPFVKGSTEDVPEKTKTSRGFPHFGLFSRRSDEINEMDKHLERTQDIAKSVQQIIATNDGYRCQFHVDDKGTIMVIVFGVYPHSHCDDAFRSVKCSLELRAVFEKLEVNATIGVATGDIYAGTVGSESRKQYTVMGDVVNLSARLASHSKCKIGGICCEEITHTLVNHSIKMQDLGEINVKGKEGPIHIYTPLSAIMKTEQPLLTPARNKFGETLCRTEETKQLLNAFLALKNNGTGQIVLIEADPGMGKTQLMRNLYQTAVLSPLLVVCAKAHPTYPLFYVWKVVLEQCIAVTMGEQNNGSNNTQGGRRGSIPGAEMEIPLPTDWIDPKKRTKMVLEFLSHVYRDKFAHDNIEKHLPSCSLLNRILGVNLSSHHESRDATFVSERTVTFLVQLIEMICGSSIPSATPMHKKRSSLPFSKGTPGVLDKYQGMVLFLEDAHDVDADSLAVLLNVMSSVWRLRLLLVLSCRTIPDHIRAARAGGKAGPNLAWVDVRNQLSSVIVVEPKGLDRTSVNRLLCQRLGARTLPAPVLDLVCDRTGGNPLYALELAHSLVQHEVIGVVDGDLVILSFAKLQNPELPHSLLALVNQRIDRLSVELALVSKLASVFGGHPFSIGLLTELYSLSEGHTDDAFILLAVTSLVQQDIFVRVSTVAGETMYDFATSECQSACYHRLLYSQRVYLHLSFGTYLRRQLRKYSSEVLFQYSLAVRAADESGQKNVAGLDEARAFLGTDTWTVTDFHEPTPSAAPSRPNPEPIIFPSHSPVKPGHRPRSMSTPNTDGGHSVVAPTPRSRPPSVLAPSSSHPPVLPRPTLLRDFSVEGPTEPEST